MADTNRRINIWINGQEVENNFKSISDAMRMAKNELANMTIGSQAYIDKTKQISALNNILDKHREAQGLIATGWRKVLQDYKQETLSMLSGNLLTNVFEKVTSFLPNVVTKFSDWQKSFSDTLTNLTGPEIEKYEARLASTSKSLIDLGIASNDVNKSMFDAVSAGISAGDATNFLNQAARLSIGGVTSLSTSVDGLTTIINAYKLSADKAAVISDSFFTAQKFGKTTVSQLASEVGKVIPVAKNAGISFQEVLSAVSALTLGGISTSESVTYLKAALQALIKPSADAEKILRQFGVPVGVSEIKARGLGETLKALNNLIQKNPDAVAKAIPSVEGLTAVYTMSGEGLAKYDEILQGVMTDIGENSSLSQAYTMKQETLAQVMARVKGQVEVLFINLGEKLAPAFSKVMSSVGSLTGTMMKAGTFIMNHIQAFLFVIKTLAIVTTSYISYSAALKLIELWESRTMAVTILQNAVFRIRAALLTAQTMATQLFAAASAFLTGDIEAATIAMQRFNMVSKSNMIGLLVAGVTAAVAAYMMFSENATKAKEAQVKFTNEISDGLAESKTLFDQLQKTNEGTELRKQLIQEVNEKYGKYLSSLLTEKSSLEDIYNAQNEVNNAMIHSIALKNQTEETNTIFAEQMKREQAAFADLAAKTNTTSVNIQSAFNDYTKGNISSLSAISSKFMDLHSSERMTIDQIIAQRELDSKSIDNIVSKYEMYLNANRNPIETEINNLLGKKKKLQGEIFDLNKTATGFFPEETKTIAKEEIKIIDEEIRKIDEAIAKLRDKQKQPTKKTSSDYKSGPSEDDLKKQKKLLDDYEKAYYNLVKKIDDFKGRMGMDLLSPKDKEIAELSEKYKEESRMHKDAFKEWEKDYVGPDRIAKIRKYNERLRELYLYYEVEKTNVDKKYEKEKEEKRKEVDQKFSDFLAKGTAKEISAFELAKVEKIKTLQEFLKELEKAGLTTGELYAKISEEITRVNNSKEETVLFGLTKSKFDKLKKQILDIVSTIDKVKNIFSEWDNLKKAQEDAEMQRAEDQNTKKKAMLDQRLKSGIISQQQFDDQVAKMDAEIQRKKKKAAHDQAEREKRMRIFEIMLNTASAVVEALPNVGLSIAAGIIGGIQLATAIATPIPALGDGGEINTPTVALIGERGREIVFSNKMLKDPVSGPQLQYWADVQSGRISKPVQPNWDGMQKAIGSNAQSNVVTNNYQTINNTVDNSELKAMRKEIIEMTTEIKKLKYVKAMISSKTLSDFNDDQELIKMYSSL